MKRIISYIISFLMAILLLALTVIIIISSTILNSNFLLSSLEKCDYHTLIDTNIKSGIEGYIKQSGFEKEVFDDIYTKENLKSDIEKMVNSLYSNKEVEIQGEELKENLEKNIDTYLTENNINTDKKNIDSFVTEIVKIYVNEVSHPVYLDTARKAITSISTIMSKITIGVIVALVVTIFALVLLNLKELRNVLKYIGVSLLTLALSILIAIFIVKSRVNINSILILNPTFTLLVVSIIKQIVTRFVITTAIAVCLAIGLIATSRMIEKNK